MKMTVLEKTVHNAPLLALMHALTNGVGHHCQSLLLALTLALSLVTGYSNGDPDSDALSTKMPSRKPGMAFSTTLKPPNSISSPVLDWTWIYGSQLYNQSSWLKHNVSHVPDNPGARGGSAFWIDSKHKLWMFSGLGFDGDNTATEAKLLSDFWLFDTPNNTWRSLKQQTTDGVSLPPPRRHASACGVSGIMFVIYGGRGKDQVVLNDTWVYMLRNSTWLSLNDQLLKIPSARFDMVSWCLVDRLIIFGGVGLNNEIQSDVWQFTFHNLAWEKIEMKLEHFTDDAYNHVYPAPRNGAASWVGHNQTMYMFGGNIKDGVNPDLQNSLGFVSDLWRLDYKGNEFTWVYIRGYTKTPCGHMGIYGKFGHGENSTMPGCRTGATTWVDGNGNIYLMGGKGVDSVAYANTKRSDKFLADIWLFDIAKQQWVWVGGSTHGNKAPRYGTLGLHNAENTPGSRSHAVAWPIQSDTIYLFGGVRTVQGNLGYMDDLWRLCIGSKETSDLVFLLPFSSGVLFLVCFSGVMTVAVLFGLGVFLKKCIDLPRHSPSRSPVRDYHIKYSPLSNDNSLEMT
ncbi:uncharacterized protein LOC135485040 [Lineus longissimus]|uniref:uncharacterized protein LOC135485040 n=1 Tax=Lineus longissimus TaxID=88925 RepID=UPI00315CA1FD